MTVDRQARTAAVCAVLIAAACSSYSNPTPQASQVILTTQPAGVVVGGELQTQPVAELADDQGRLVSTATGTVEIVLDGSGVIRGTLSMPTTGGVAHFTDIGVDPVGVVKLDFNVLGLRSAVSDPLEAPQ